MKKQYAVIVGNVGTVFSGTNKKDAQAMYREYLEISNHSKGRVGGEDVVLTCNDEPILEHFGALHDDN